MSTGAERAIADGATPAPAKRGGLRVTYAPPWVLNAFGLALAAFGMLFVVLFLLAPWWRAPAAASWDAVPAVVAVVLNSELVTNRSSDGNTYRPDISFRYHVDGEAFESDVFGPAGGVSAGNRSESYEAVKAYPVGAEVVVYVDPTDPTSAMLTRT